MKKAFTLIEVMIAVFIFFIVVISVMNIVSNNKHLINLLLENRKFALKSSVAFLNPNTKNNYDRVRDFNIKNPKVIDILKKDNIEVETMEDLTQEFNESNFNLKEVINKLKAYDKTHSTIIYSIGIKWKSLLL